MYYCKHCCFVPFRNDTICYQVRITLISQLIKGILIVLQKLLKYFNSTATSAFTILSLLVLSNNLDLNLNAAELVMEFTGLSL